MRLIIITGVVFGVVLVSGSVGCDIRVSADEAAETATDGPAGSPAVTTADAGPTPEVPDEPVTGTIHGRAFTYEDATIEEGILELRQGEDFFADLEATIFLFLEDKAEVPEGRSWQIDCDEGWRAGYPHVHISWRDGDEGTPRSESTTCDYRLYLELGEETATKTLPGGLVLRAPGLDTEIAGRFEAAIEGFRMVDGQVDLGQDDLEVAHHLAETWLAERNGGPIEVIDHALAWLHLEAPKDGPQAGYSVYWWRSADGGDERITKLQFSKRDGIWGVERELEVWQIAKGRPLSPRTGLGSSFEQRAARRLEAEHVAENGRRPIFVTKARTSYNPQAGLAEVKLHYTLDPERARDSSGMLDSDDEGPIARYLFRTTAEAPGYRDPDSWTLERRLDPREVVDYKAGRVVTE